MPDSHMAFSLVFSASPVKIKELLPFVRINGCRSQDLKTSASE